MAGDAFIAYFPVLIIASIFGGWRPMLFALGLSIAAGAYFFLPPVGFAVGPQDVGTLIAFLLVGLALIALTELLHAAIERLAARADRAELALHETSDQLLHAQETERQRIAIELHDSMSQHLAGLMLGLGQLRRRAKRDPAVQVLIDEMANLTQQAVRETRVLSYLMNGSARDSEGLEASSRRFAEGFGRRTGLKITFEARGCREPVDAATRHAIFRVIQEALTNVYRHADATEVEVSLVTGEDELAAQISDNGQGIPVGSAEAPLGVGIPGMRARVEQLGGTLRIASDANGTVVAATLPMRSPL
jgi:signal transduction histidine kinase